MNTPPPQRSPQPAFDYRKLTAWLLVLYALWIFWKFVLDGLWSVVEGGG